MENLSKKVGYLKGLMEGAQFDTGSANGKLMAGIVDLLGDLTDRVEAMDELLDDLNDYVESIDEDLTQLEGEQDDDFRFPDDDEDDEDDDTFDGEDTLHLLRPTPTEPEEEALIGNLCPKCNRMFFTSAKGDADADYECPHCHAHVNPLPLTPENAPIAKPVKEE